MTSVVAQLSSGSVQAVQVSVSQGCCMLSGMHTLRSQSLDYLRNSTLSLRAELAEGVWCPITSPNQIPPAGQSKCFTTILFTGVEAAEQRLAAHTGALSEVIEHAETSLGIQAFIASHLIFFQSGLWYIGASWAALLVSSTPRTINARLPIILIIGCSLMLEWHLTTQWTSGLAGGGSPGQFRLGKWHVTTLSSALDSFGPTDGSQPLVGKRGSSHVLSLAYSAGLTLEESCSAVRWSCIAASCIATLLAWYSFDDPASSARAAIAAVDSKIGFIAQVLTSRPMAGSGEKAGFSREVFNITPEKQICSRRLDFDEFIPVELSEEDDEEYTEGCCLTNSSGECGDTLLDSQTWHLSLQGGNGFSQTLNVDEVDEDGQSFNSAESEDRAFEMGDVSPKSPRAATPRSRSPHRGSQYRRVPPPRASKTEATNAIKELLLQGLEARNTETIEDFCSWIQCQLTATILRRRHRDNVLASHEIE